MNTEGESKDEEMKDKESNTTRDSTVYEPREEKESRNGKVREGEGYNKENPDDGKKDDCEEISIKEDDQEAGITRRTCKDHRDQERIY